MDPLEGRERALRTRIALKYGQGRGILLDREELALVYRGLGRRSLEQERWISVEERQPPIGPWLTVVIGGVVQTCPASFDGREWDWLVDADPAPKEAVTHWMPQPKAPAPPVHKGDS